MDNNMEPVQIPQSDLINFKEKVKRWLMLDIQISENVTVQVVQSTIQSLLKKPDTKK